MNRSTPGFLVLHCLLEFAQTHVHSVGDAIHLILDCCIPIGQRHVRPHWISSITSAKWQSSLYYSLDQLWTISFSKLRAESPMESDGNVLYKSKVHKHSSCFLVIGLARYNNLLFILETEPCMSSIIRPFPPPLPKIHCPKSSVVFLRLMSHPLM